MIDPGYETKIREGLIFSGRKFPEMVATLSPDEKALLIMIGECGSGPISIFENPTVTVSVNSGRDKRSTIDVAPNTIRRLIYMKLIEKSNWNEPSRSLRLTLLGRVALTQLSI